MVVVPFMESAFMRKRAKMRRGYSKKLFRHTAGSGAVHPLNEIQNAQAVMRGGIRL